MPVLNTPKQVVPVRTHCHPLIGSFLIPPTTPRQRIDREVWGCQEPARPHWHRIKAGTNAARRQSGKPEHTQAQEHPKTWPHSSRLYHQGVIGTWAFQSIFKGGNLIHMCTMKLAILYPALPPLFCSSSCPPPGCNPAADVGIQYVLFLSHRLHQLSTAASPFSLKLPQVWPRHLRLWRRTRMPNLYSVLSLTRFHSSRVCLWLRLSLYVCMFVCYVCTVNMQIRGALNKLDLFIMCLLIKLWSWV